MNKFQKVVEINTFGDLFLSLVINGSTKKIFTDVFTD